MNRIGVAAWQQGAAEGLQAVGQRRFAYNEDPTIAVATDCWFRARLFLTRPFFVSGRVFEATS